MLSFNQILLLLLAPITFVVAISILRRVWKLLSRRFFSNPGIYNSMVYKDGNRYIKQVIANSAEQARQKVAEAENCKPEEIISVLMVGELSESRRLNSSGSILK